MTQEGGRGVFRYIITGLVVVLLAPYAGCHIFTSRPNARLGELQVDPSSPVNAQKAPNTRAELPLPEPSERETNNSASLDDIEALLGRKPTDQ